MHATAKNKQRFVKKKESEFMPKFVSAPCQNAKPEANFGYGCKAESEVM